MNEQIIEMEGGTVNDAIEIHQRFCKIGMKTIKVYQSWFLLNSACYFWLIVYVVVVFLTQSSHMQSWPIFYHLSLWSILCVCLSSSMVTSCQPHSHVFKADKKVKHNLAVEAESFIQ